MGATRAKVKIYPHPPRKSLYTPLRPTWRVGQSQGFWWLNFYSFWIIIHRIKRLIGLTWFLKYFSTILHSQLNYHIYSDTPFKVIICLVTRVQRTWLSSAPRRSAASGNRLWRRLRQNMPGKNTGGPFRNGIFFVWGGGVQAALLYINLSLIFYFINWKLLTFI